MRSSATAARRLFGAAILISVATLATACTSSGSGSSGATKTVTAPPPSSSSSHPAAPTAPASSATMTPATTACGTSQLHVSAGNSSGAAGTIYYDLIFTNSSSASCTLRGYPGVSFVTAASDAGSQVGADAKRNPVYKVTTITLAPGASAHAQLGIAQADNYPASSCNPVNTHFMKVFPPGQTVAAYFSFPSRTCASTSTPTMHISTIVSGA